MDKKFVFCWVSDDENGADPGAISEKKPLPNHIIIDRVVWDDSLKYYVSSKGDGWKNATPMTQEEIKRHIKE